jgi:hypothetical protein
MGQYRIEREVIEEMYGASTFIVFQVSGPKCLENKRFGFSKRKCGFL